MIDDDLDRLLSDIDGESDFSSSRDESLRFKQKIARKSDSHVEAAVNGLTTDEAFLQKLKTIHVDQDILVFKNGVVNAIRQHEVLTQRFRRFLIEMDINDTVRQAVQKYKYTFLRYVENIDKVYHEYAINLNDDIISKEARKGFSGFFQGYEEDNKVNFLMLKEFFLRLREFNSRVKKEWNELANSISVINLLDEGKILYQELNGVIVGGIDFSNATDKFMERLALVLSIPGHDFDVLERDINNKIIYHNSYDYRYNVLFDINAAVMETDTGRSLDKMLTEDEGKAVLMVETSDHGEKHTIHDQKNNETVSTQLKVKKAKDAAPAVKFTVRGTTSWNTREPYLLRVDNDKLEKETDDFNTSFYFITPEEKGPSHEGAVKRAIIRFLSDKTLVIREQYEEFIFKTIIQLARDLIRFFEFTEEQKNLFIYHLGPATMYKQIINMFQVERYGFCYKYLPGNKVVRFIPGESIKIKIIGWHEENINSLRLEFDKVQYFDEVRRAVAGKYQQELDKNIKQLDELIVKLKLDQNRNFNRDDFFKSKWNEWFGTPEIVAYNRFIERTIFK